MVYAVIYTSRVALAYTSVLLYFRPDLCWVKYERKNRKINSKATSYLFNFFVMCFWCCVQVYLSLPAGVSMTEGHCLICPLQHHCSATGLDEDVWTEIQVSFHAFLCHAEV